jgi:membrane fusion protein, multidrug efflux system
MKKRFFVAWLTPLFLFPMVLMGANSTATSAKAPIVVQVATVTIQPVPLYVDALGSLSAVHSVTISSQTDGRVAKIYFKNGQEVGNNMPIIQLDDATAKANYASALTALNLSKRKYERAKLLPAGAMSQQSVEALAAAVQSDDATAKSDLALLNQKTITAPFAGVLGAFKSQVGDYTTAGDPLVSLVNTAQLRANFNVAQALLPKLKLGQLVKVVVNAYPKKTFYGTVNFISPSVSDTTRATPVQALVQNAKNLLAPGMFCHISQQIGVDKKALLIPEEAVSADIKGFYVYKVVGSKVAKTYVSTGTRLNGQVQITHGLKKGQTIVTAGIQKLLDGSSITISNNDSGTS